MGLKPKVFKSQVLKTVEQTALSTGDAVRMPQPGILRTATELAAAIF